ncbi:DUF177 domain-containing protein [Desulfomarina sp.]
MKLVVEKITTEPDYYTISSEDWVPFPERSIDFSARLAVTVYRQIDESVILKGKIEGDWTVSCDRCGERVQHRLSGDFFYQGILRGETVFETGEKEVLAEDVNILYLEESFIDLFEILQEQVYLALPVRVLCREDCKGMCPQCGVILNDADCRCLSDTVDSPFAVLKKICK